MSPIVDYERRAKAKMMHKLWLRIADALDVLLLTLPFALCWFFFYEKNILMPFNGRGDLVVVLLFALLYIIFCNIYKGFSISLMRISELLYSQALAALMADAVLYIVICILAQWLPAVWPILLALAAQFVLAVLWCLCAKKIYFAKNNPLRTVVIWDHEDRVNELVNARGIRNRFEITASVHISACAEDPASVLTGTEALFLCGVHSHDRNQIVKYCIDSGIRVYVIPRVGDAIMSGARPLHMFHLPMMMLERYNPTPEYLFIKRAFDIVLSGAALIALSPLMLVVALLIRRDGGTVFYRQRRLTKDRREFDVLKFRSMRMDAEKDGVARLSTGGSDDRITPVGRVIRACRIDELPQLINILRGDMSIVGPRPERPEIAEQYERELPEFALRLQAKAGLTGYAQVYGKYNTTPYDKLLFDLQYLARPSLGEDLRIIFATVKILFMPESTEGVGTGQITAMDDADVVMLPETSEKVIQQMRS